MRIVIGRGDAAVACQTGDQLQWHALGLQPGDIRVAAAVGRQLAHALHLPDGGVVTPPERPHAVAGVAAGQAPDERLPAVLPEVLCRRTGILRNRDRADSAFAFGRAQNRVVVHRFHPFSQWKHTKAMLNKIYLNYLRELYR